MTECDIVCNVILQSQLYTKIKKMFKYHGVSYAENSGCETRLYINMMRGKRISAGDLHILLHEKTDPGNLVSPYPRFNKISHFKKF